MCTGSNIPSSPIMVLQWWHVSHNNIVWQAKSRCIQGISNNYMHYNFIASKYALCEYNYIHVPTPFQVYKKIHSHQPNPSYSLTTIGFLPLDTVATRILSLKKTHGGILESSAGASMPSNWEKSSPVDTCHTWGERESTCSSDCNTTKLLCTVNGVSISHKGSIEHHNTSQLKYCIIILSKCNELEHGRQDSPTNSYTTRTNMQYKNYFSFLY